SMPIQQKVIIGLLATVVAIGGIWYAVGKKGTTSNTNNVNKIALNSNINSLGTNNNVNVNNTQTKLYQGNGFSIRYPADWTIVGEPGKVPRFTPKNTTFYFEGSIDYPISVGTTTKTADEEVSLLPAKNKSTVTINGYAGYKAYPNCPTCGNSRFYIFTLADNKSSVSISYTGDSLEQTDGPTIDQSTLRQVFEQIVNSIQISK
ncbi:MAG: hypothetical protein HY420_03325, partial [Candidatus Kerfeldbacteria bacterium]|nr:hypothetical protein [Candidatus Kerfeldbacteria bacterium]